MLAHLGSLLLRGLLAWRHADRRHQSGDFFLRNTDASAAEVHERDVAAAGHRDDRVSLHPDQPTDGVRSHEIRGRKKLCVLVEGESLHQVHFLLLVNNDKHHVSRNR